MMVCSARYGCQRTRLPYIAFLYFTLHSTSSDPVFHDYTSHWSKHTFRMKLYAVHIIFLMPHRHNLSIVRQSCYFKAIRQAVLVNNPTVITSHKEFIRHSVEYIIIS